MGIIERRAGGKLESKSFITLFACCLMAEYIIQIASSSEHEVQLEVPRYSRVALLSLV